MKAAMRILTLVAAGTVTAAMLALGMRAIDAPEQQDPADHPVYAMNISLPEGALGVIQPSPGHRANARLTALTALGLIALMWTQPCGDRQKHPQGRRAMPERNRKSRKRSKPDMTSIKVIAPTINDIPNPLYSCANEACAIEVSYPANMLVWFPGTRRDGKERDEDIEPPPVDAGFYCRECLDANIHIPADIDLSDLRLTLADYLRRTAENRR